MNVSPAMPAPAGPEITVAKAEQNLFDHITSGLEGRKGSSIASERMANPGNLLGEAVGDLRGYLDRVRVMNGMFSPRGPDAKKHGGGLSESAMSTRPDRAPADAGSNKGAEAGQPLINESTLEHAARLMLDSLRFSIETNLVVRGTTQVSNSANTLIRGQ